MIRPPSLSHLKFHCVWMWGPKGVWVWPTQIRRKKKIGVIKKRKGIRPSKWGTGEEYQREMKWK